MRQREVRSVLAGVGRLVEQYVKWAKEAFWEIEPERLREIVVTSVLHQAEGVAEGAVCGHGSCAQTRLEEDLETHLEQERLENFAKRIVGVLGRGQQWEFWLEHDIQKVTPCLHVSPKLGESATYDLTKLLGVLRQDWSVDWLTETASNEVRLRLPSGRLRLVLYHKSPLRPVEDLGLGPNVVSNPFEGHTPRLYGCRSITPASRKRSTDDELIALGVKPKPPSNPFDTN